MDGIFEKNWKKGRIFKEERYESSLCEGRSFIGVLLGRVCGVEGGEGGFCVVGFGEILNVVEYGRAC